jgi:hypothetical protein
LDAVQVTVQPCALAIWIAAIPTDEEPPLISTRSPGVIFPWTKRPSVAVKPTKPKPAASVNFMEEGLRAICREWIEMYDANAPCFFEGKLVPTFGGSLVQLG